MVQCHIRLCDLHVRLKTLANLEIYTLRLNEKVYNSTQATAQNFAKTRLLIGDFFARCLNLLNVVRILFKFHKCFF